MISSSCSLCLPFTYRNHPTMPKASTPSAKAEVTDTKTYSHLLPVSDPPKSNKKNIDHVSQPDKRGSKSARLPWTGDERLFLFRIAITKGASIANFEGVLEGRTGHLCYCQW
jgi:hypothetical protein